MAAPLQKFGLFLNRCHIASWIPPLRGCTGMPPASPTLSVRRRASVVSRVPYRSHAAHRLVSEARRPMSPTLWVWLFPLFGPPLFLPLFYCKVGCLPESKLWVHPSGGASATDQGKVSGLSRDGGGGNVVLANSSKPELPPSPLTAFVKVIGLPFI